LDQLSEIERLQQRRRALVAESQMLRSQIAAEVENLRPAAVWVVRGYRWSQTLWAAWPLIGGAAGLLFRRKSPSLVRKMAKAWSWWRLGKKAAGLWHRFGPRRQRAEREHEPEV
jgi:hypothetical protein